MDKQNHEPSVRKKKKKEYNENVKITRAGTARENWVPASKHTLDDAGCVGFKKFKEGGKKFARRGGRRVPCVD